MLLDTLLFLVDGCRMVNLILFDPTTDTNGSEGRRCYVVIHALLRRPGGPSIAHGRSALRSVDVHIWRWPAAAGAPRALLLTIRSENGAVAPIGASWYLCLKN